MVVAEMTFDADAAGIAMCDALLEKPGLSEELRAIVLEIRAAREAPDDEYHDFVPRLTRYAKGEWRRQQVNYAHAAKLTWGDFSPETYPEWLEEFEKWIVPLRNDDDVERAVIRRPNAIQGPFPTISPGRRICFSNDRSGKIHIIPTMGAGIDVLWFARRTSVARGDLVPSWSGLDLPLPPGGVDNLVDTLRPDRRSWRLLWVEERDEHEMALVFSEEPRGGYELIRWALLAGGASDVWLE